MWAEKINAIIDNVVEIKKDIHRHPELGFWEHRTSNLIVDQLKTYGFTDIQRMALTGVIGTLDSGRPGKTVMLRADIDALEIQEANDGPDASTVPGKMHACGHDAHTAMLLGAAHVLAQNKDSFSGKIKFLFQPAEEGYYDNDEKMMKEKGYPEVDGAKCMIYDGAMKNVDYCAALHVDPGLETGHFSIPHTMAMAASDEFRIYLYGKGGHAAYPEEAIDPTCAMAELVTAIHMLTNREISATDPVKISIGVVQTLGSVSTSIPERILLEGSIRTFHEDQRRNLMQRIETLARCICEANRCTATVEFLCGYAATINDATISEKAYDVLSKRFGADHVRLTEPPRMGSENFGYFQKEAPGVFYYIGAGGEDASGRSGNHSPTFCVDDDALRYGIESHIEVALALLAEN